MSVCDLSPECVSVCVRAGDLSVCVSVRAGDLSVCVSVRVGDLSVCLCVCVSVCGRPECVSVCVRAGALSVCLCVCACRRPECVCVCACGSPVCVRGRRSMDGGLWFPMRSRHLPRLHHTGSYRLYPGEWPLGTPS